MINTSVLVLVAIVLFLMLIVLLIAHKGKPRMNKNYFLQHWQTIEGLKDYSSAVVKADALLDEALKHANIKGGTTGERLNNAAGFLADINSAWEAHKLRNQVVHEPDFKVTASQCKKVLHQYKKALRDLGAL